MPGPTLTLVFFPSSCAFGLPVQHRPVPSVAGGGVLAAAKPECIRQANLPIKIMFIVDIHVSSMNVQSTLTDAGFCCSFLCLTLPEVTVTAVGLDRT